MTVGQARFALILTSAARCFVACFVMVSAAAADALGTFTFAVAELVTSSASTRNAWRAKSLDLRLRGQLVPLCYVASGMLLPAEAETVLAGLVGAAAAIFIAALRLTMLDCYTAGAAAWSHLVETGPYAFVRHPQTAGALALRAYLVALHPSWLNLGCGIACLFVCLAETRVEEEYLATVPAWSEYARRVRWRLVPGVW